MNYRADTETPATVLRVRTVVAATFLFAGAAALYNATFDPPPLHPAGDALRASPSSSIPGNYYVDDDGQHRRSLSIALPHGGCQVTYASLAPAPIPPTWQASFPGSGSRMTWSLVEALTGVRTNDDYNSHERGYERVVAVKTHYPVKDARRRFGELDQLFNRAMVILRNPINAIPSYFNLQYEHLNHLPNHSTRGPNEDWIKYRDDKNSGLSYQLNHYENFVSYWMEKYPERSQLLMLSYEDIIDDFMGPLAAGRIASFLGESEGVNPIAPESVPCVWETIVNYKNVAPPKAGKVNAVFKDSAGGGNDAAQGGRRNLQEEEAATDEVVLKPGKTHADPSSLRVGPKVRPYTTDNLQAMLDMFQRLMEKFSYDEDFVRIMRAYFETVSNTIPVDE